MMHSTKVRLSNIGTVETVKEPTKCEVNSSAAGDCNDNVKTNLTMKQQRPTGIGLGNIFNGKPIHLKQTSLKDVLKDVESSTDNTLNGDQDRVRVLYPYQPTQPDELELQTDDVVQVLNRTTREEGWWQGKNLRTRKIGLFPDNFVTSIKDHRSDNIARSPDSITPGGKIDHCSTPNMQNDSPPKVINNGTPLSASGSNFSSSVGSEPPKVAIKPKNLAVLASAKGTTVSSTIRDIPKGSVNNATGRVGPTMDTAAMSNNRLFINQSPGPMRATHYRVTRDKKDEKDQPNSSTEDFNNDVTSQRSGSPDTVNQLLTGPTMDRPKQAGRRLPSKFAFPNQDTNVEISRDPSGIPNSQIARNVPTPNDEPPSHTDTSDVSRSFASKRTTDPTGKNNNRMHVRTTVPLNRSEGSTGSADIVRRLEPNDISSMPTSRSQSQNLYNANQSLLNDLRQQIKDMAFQMDQLKEANSQLRSDMVHGQRVLTERLHSLTSELDEVRKQRAADAVELSRLRTILTQMDCKLLTSFSGSAVRRSSSCMNGGKHQPTLMAEQPPEFQNNDEHCAHHQSEPPDASHRMVGDSFGGPPPMKIIDVNQSHNHQGSFIKNSFVRHKSQPFPKT